MTTYRESLRAPLSWWLLGALFAASLGWIFLVVTTWTIAITATVIVALPTAWAIWSYGALTLEVHDGDVRIGKATLEKRFHGPARPLSAEAFRHAMGPGADARAYIRTRPYIRTGALIPVVDERDATPYWLVSTRQPEAFVASLAQSGKDQANVEPIGENTVVEED